MPEQQQSGVKLGVFVGGLAVALIAGFGLGKVVKPASPTAGGPVPQATASEGHVHATGASAGSEVGGLAISSGGYTLTPLAHDATKLSFVIKGSDGKPVTDFTIVHEKPLHLILVRRDFTGYQHLHPTMAPDGTWSVAADLSKPGLWRVFADFAATAPGGAQNAMTLGYDITVPGDYQPQPVPPAARESTVDGQTVTYEGTPVVGATSPMLFRVAGNPTLEPYLGSFGHLVVVRQGDLAYVHVHPEPQLSGGAVKFWLAAPSPGTYRMYFDYQIGGKVRTNEFTLVVG
ncbi:hypothetical protein [Allorhizocola rhizosphaerae]|uniref:hypothetical protein n=1 Tax=Allorhizocola rhizosphaerae TaxID=1872709 RepID=UPI000E3B9EBE|nr:hypothetical protein [Allorhizocola rhizosphaerae]